MLHCTVIDCAEGTLRQFSLQPRRITGKTLKVGSVNKIFVTHMHRESVIMDYVFHQSSFVRHSTADHVMGLPTLLRNILGFHRPGDIPSRGTPVSTCLHIACERPLNDISFTQPKVNLYGPAGLRTFLRTTLSLTRTRTADCYAVHELLTPADQRTPCNDEVLHENEGPGQDVLCDKDGFWRNFTEGRSVRGAVYMCAGPLVHRGSVSRPLSGIIFQLTDRRPLHRLYHPRARVFTCASKAGHSRGHVFRRPVHPLDCLNARTPLAPGSRGHRSLYARGHRPGPCCPSSTSTSSIESTGTWSLDACTSRCMRREVGCQAARSKPYWHEVRPFPCHRVIAVYPA
jgi:hypothetical protein